MDLVHRRLQEIAVWRMAESPVVLLQGPRSVGKSTLLQILAGRHGGHVVDLDDPAVRAAVSNDPELFVSGRRPVFIDEYQHVPVLLDSIKAELTLIIHGLAGRGVLGRFSGGGAAVGVVMVVGGGVGRIGLWSVGVGGV